MTGIWTTLSKDYGSPKPFLNHKTQFQHLVAIILSAQSTDVMVNTISPQLFKNLGTPEKMQNASLITIEGYIKRLGLYHSKAKHIQQMAGMLCTLHKSKVPKTAEELIALPGVGRKTAHVYLSATYNLPLIGVDTHVMRLAQRLGLSASKNPNHVEQDLYSTVPVRWHHSVNFYLVSHGRHVCDAKRPNCGSCPIAKYCPSCTTKGKILE